MEQRKIILASASPRRRELLENLGLDFDIRIPEIDERPLPGEQPREHVERLAAEKAAAVFMDGVTIAADTIVVLGDQILGKPTHAAHAREMLRALSANKHEVITGVCIRDTEHILVFSVLTKVVFRKLSDKEVEVYIESGEPMDKAGAYAIQGRAASFVQTIEGSYTNIVGLPLCEVHNSLRSFL